MRKLGFRLSVAFSFCSLLNSILVMLAVIVLAVVISAAIAGSPSPVHGRNLTTASLEPFCPPGFVHQENSCVCANWPEGMIVCDEDSQKASMKISYCMTYINETGELRAGACPKNYFRNNFYKFYYPLPSSAADLNEDVCGPLNSKGLLCSECQEGFASSAPTSNSRIPISCVNCTGNTGWLKYLTSHYLPISIFLFAIVTLNINIISGPINGFIFFSQVSTAYDAVAVMESLLKAQAAATSYSDKPVLIIHSLYRMWNLNFFSNLIPPFCLTSHLSNFQGIALQYGIAFYPLFLITVLYVCIKLHDSNFRPLVWCWKPFHKCFSCCKRNIHPRSYIVHAFATVTLLSYVKLLNIINVQLLFDRLYNGMGEVIITTAHLDPNIQFFHIEHLPFALSAIFVLVTFIAIPPVVLLLYQCSWFQRCLTRCRLNTLALRTFVEIFQGPYKYGADGTFDYRYFAGVYFVLRIIVFILSFGGLFSHTFGSALLFFITAVLFALLRPYRKHIYNVVDAIIFTILAIVFTLISAHAVIIFFTGHPSTIVFVLTDLLYSLPLLSLIIYTISWLLDRKTGCIRKLKRYRPLSFLLVTDAENADFEIPHRLEYPSFYVQYGTMSSATQTEGMH